MGWNFFVGVSLAVAKMTLEAAIFSSHSITKTQKLFGSGTCLLEQDIQYEKYCELVKAKVAEGIS